MQGKWEKKPQAGTTVAFVHGILSSGEKCWLHDNGSYWPDLLGNESGLESLGIWVFTYQTGIFSGTYSVSDIVDALKEFMRLDGVLKCERLIFVCHSLGGIVVRKFLVQRAIDLIEDDKEIGLFLIASPTLGSNYADWLSPIAYALGHSQADALRFVRDNVWLEDLDRQFKNLKEGGRLKIKGKELGEDKFIEVKLKGAFAKLNWMLRKVKWFWRKQLVEPFSAMRYFGDPVKIPGSDHFSIAKPEDNGAFQHRLLCQFIESEDVLPREMPLQLRKGKEKIKKQLDTPELLEALANPDPVVCLPAAKALKGRSDLGEELIDIFARTRVVKEAVRTVLGSVPEQSAKLLVAAIKDCGVTGETWHRARRASDYFTVDHSPYAEKSIVDLLRGTGNIEVERHSLTALGNVGCLALYSAEVDQVLNSDYGYEKCFGYALEASARNFVLAREDYFCIEQASRLLLHLIDLREKRGGPGQSYRLPFGSCSIRHADVILATWLESSSDRVKELGLKVLGQLRLARSASRILEIWRKRRDDDIGKMAAGVLWCIGEPNSIKTLLKQGIDTIQGEGLVHIDNESFERFLPQVLATPGRTWLAYRAIGLLQRIDKISLLRDGLSHTDPTARGSAALALAQLGERDTIKRAYEESHDEDERIFTVLAALTAKLIEYATVEQQLRSDLAKASLSYAIEAQEDIVSTLQILGVEPAKTLAEAWKPFYGRGNIDIGMFFG